MVKKLQITLCVIFLLIAQDFSFIRQADAAAVSTASTSVALDSVLNLPLSTTCMPKKLPLITTQKVPYATALIESIAVQSVPDVLPSPTPTPTVSPVEDETSLQIISPTNTETPTVSPTGEPVTITPAAPISVTPGTGLNAEVIFAMVNAHRTAIGLPAFEKEPRLCDLAASRAPEIYNEVYVTGNMHAGLRARKLPYSVNENIISMNSEQAAFNWWLNSPIHRQAIEGSTRYSCIACSGNSCSEVFSNFDPAFGN